MPHDHRVTHCSLYFQSEYFLFALALLCLVIMTFIYIRILVLVKRHQNSNLYPLRKNKKTLLTTLLIVGSFMACWLPMCLFQITMAVRKRVNPEAVHQDLETLYIVNEYLLDLLLVNTVSDPIIYSARLKEVRVRLKILLCWSSCCRNKCCLSQNDQTNNIRFRYGQSWSQQSTRSTQYIMQHNGSCRAVPMLIKDEKSLPEIKSTRCLLIKDDKSSKENMRVKIAHL